MKIAKVLICTIMALALLASVAGCAPAATPTPAPATAVPPTAAPATTSSGYVIPVTKCAPNCTYKDMTVGFIQTGSESGWRTANNVFLQGNCQTTGRHPEVLRCPEQDREPDFGFPHSSIRIPP